MAGFDRMKTNDQKFLDGIVDGKTVISAAKAAGISERTAYRNLGSDRDGFTECTTACTKNRKQGQIGAYSGQFAVRYDGTPRERNSHKSPRFEGVF